MEVEKKKSKKRAQQQSSEMDVSVKDTAVSDRHDSIHFSKEFTTTMHEADVSDDQKYRHVNMYGQHAAVHGAHRCLSVVMSVPLYSLALFDAAFHA